MLKKAGAKQGTEEKWDLVETTSRRLAKSDVIDNAVPNGIVSTLSAWKASDFADDAKPADAGLDAPESTITLTRKGDKRSPSSSARRRRTTRFT